MKAKLVNSQNPLLCRKYRTVFVVSASGVLWDYFYIKKKKIRMENTDLGCVRRTQYIRQIKQERD